MEPLSTIGFNGGARPRARYTSKVLHFVMLGGGERGKRRHFFFKAPERTESHTGVPKGNTQVYRETCAAFRSRPQLPYSTHPRRGLPALPSAFASTSEASLVCCEAHFHSLGEGSETGRALLAHKGRARPSIIRSANKMSRAKIKYFLPRPQCNCKMLKTQDL
jgi:hypothetical protein